MLTVGQLKNKNFLLLEDSRVSRRSIYEYLEKHGATVDMYENLDRQNEFLGRTYDYAILDLQLGNTSTINLIPLLKSVNSKLRIIVETAAPNQLKEHPESAALVDYLIEKPVTDSKLEKAIISSLYQPLKGKHVLIVEDARVSLNALVRIVLRLGGIPHAYTSLFEKEAILKINYDFALLDLLLRKDDTLEFIKELRDNNPNLSIFVVSSTPALLQSRPEIMSEVSYIFQKPVNDKIIERHLIRSVEQPFSDRRTVPRKSGDAGGNLWIALWNHDLNKPDLFESPHLVDISNMGLSFQSRMQYAPGDQLLMWLLHRSKRIADSWLELRGIIRWTQHVTDEFGEKTTRYGVSIDPEISRDFNELQQIVPRILES
ncbi:MAG: response regulator [Leptospiraceae bacterium]|nr:response regulator [Leptospiraceae bacterium]MCB1199782.1 response regulator [Leptospiraceae bacterium]